MKERQRWRSEEDAILRAYVKQYGPRDWHLLCHRMNVTLHRDAKSCLERWKNYLKPGIKKGSLTEEEQRLVIRLQAKHGNKWKKIAAEVPGRTAKRLGKWWEVFKEKQQREELKDCSSTSKPLSPAIEHSKYDRILENFAEKILVKERPLGEICFSFPVPSPMLPPWLSGGSCCSSSSSPSVALTLSPSPSPSSGPPHHHVAVVPTVLLEIGECCREMQEGQQNWMAHKKEAAWRLKRVELQLEAERASKRREKMEEAEARIRAIKEEERAALERIEAECREQIAGLRREAEAKEQKLALQWAAKHARMSKLMEQLGCQQWVPASEANGR